MKISEKEFIARIRDLQTPSSRVVLGINDDCAVLRNSGGERDWLVSTDLLTEGVHFECKWGTPHLLGKKSVAVNVSDIAAMGGTPKALVCALGIPPEKVKYASEVMEGISAECRKYGVDLVGGDTCRAVSHLTISLTIFGETRGKTYLKRSGACAGDLIFCTGWIGDSGLGLRMLQHPGDFRGLAETARDQAINRFLHPQVHLKLAQGLCDMGGVSAMIDVSDGLLQDLKHILIQSKVAAVLNPEKIPLSESFRKSGLQIADACGSGEDYELLFTAPPAQEERILRLAQKDCPIHVIGEIVDDREGRGEILKPEGGSWLTPGQTLGFQHF